MCSYGALSPDSMIRLVRSLAAAIPTARTHQIEGAGHAATFDATANFVQLVADTMTSSDNDFLRQQLVGRVDGPRASVEARPFNDER